MEEKQKIKYPIGGYAPGYYGCTCCICNNEFLGDKRSICCEPCAINNLNENYNKLYLQVKKYENLFKDLNKIKNLIDHLDIIIIKEETNEGTENE